MEGGGLRQRPSKRPVMEDTRTTSSTSSSATQNTSTAGSQHATREEESAALRGRSFSHLRNILQTFNVLLHVIAVTLFVAGFVFADQELHNGEECSMTYSHRRFLEVQTLNFTSTSKATKDYRLYKFVDQRDPRYQSLLRQEEPLKGSEHCRGSKIPQTDGASNQNKNTTIVLYIPGHWGSYGQARSVGAHGTQMTAPRGDPTGASRQGRLLTWDGHSSLLSNFVYEVYAVSFAEQGGALHGRILELQSDYVAHVVQDLAVGCFPLP